MDFEGLKKRYLEAGQLYNDTEFPAAPSSVYFSKVDPFISWRRPYVSISFALDIYSLNILGFIFHKAMKIE